LTIWITWLPADAGIRDQKLELCLLDLPEGVLTKILGLLGHPYLLMARVTCKALRAASIPCITCVTLDALNLMWWAGAGRLVCGLQQRLRVFSSVTHLELSISFPQDADALSVPAVLFTLRKLYISLMRDEIATVLPFLPAAQRLTFLEVNVANLDPRVMGSFPRTVRACRHLQELELCFSIANEGAERDLAEAILDIASLRAFTGIAYGTNGIFWRSLLRGVPRLPALRSLAGVQFEQEEDPTLLGALSQLTYIGCVTSAWPELRLPRLSALRALRVYVGYSDRVALVEGVRLLVQLHELELRSPLPKPGEGEGFTLEQVTRLLAALPALTMLDVFVVAPAMPPIPHAFAADGFAGLQRLSLTLGDRVDPEHVEVFAARLTGLESLEVKASVRLCAKLLASLPPIPRLTKLAADAHEEEDPSEAVGASGGFLAGLPRLRSLRLINVLEVASWNEGARYVDKLTNLSELWLETRCRVHKQLKDNVELRRPVPLWQLKYWKYMSCSCLSSAFRSSVLWEAGQIVKYAMGLPGLCPKSRLDLSFPCMCGLVFVDCVRRHRSA
jgi:hypothetical protein